MFNFKTMLRQCLLAAALACSAAGALAGPLDFHVVLNTSSMSGNGYLDLQFSGLSTAAPATATLSNFSGAFGAVDYFEGAVTFNPDGSFAIANGPDFSNLLSFAAAFGGMLGFDIGFSSEWLAAGGTDGSSFSAALLDADFNPLVADDGVARFDLVPASDFRAAGIDRSGEPGLAVIDVRVVPEPSDWLLMLTGLALATAIGRRRA